MDTSVTATSWTDHSAAFTLPAGTHKVSVQFTNDYMTQAAIGTSTWTGSRSRDDIRSTISARGLQGGSRGYESAVAASTRP